MKEKLCNIKSKILKSKKSVVVVIFVFVFIFTYSFFMYNMTNPTKLNKLFASVIMGDEPANSAFKDIHFYQVVVDAYNSNNGETKAYTDNLTDEELAKITELNYSCESWGNKECSSNDNLKIADLSGIEKLTGLISLDLSFNNIQNIDLSQNTKLEKVSFLDNNLNSINLSHNKNLTEIILQRNQLNNIDVSENEKLIELNLNSNNLNSINLIQNINLKKLLVNNNQIDNINLSQNLELVELDVSHNRLTSVDVSKHEKLEYLNLSSNDLDAIDVRNNHNLRILNYYYYGANKITNIDLTNNERLEKLSLNYTKITNIDLSHNAALTNLNLEENQLSSIDLSHNLELRDLNVGGNKLTQIDLSHNTKLESYIIWGELGVVNRRNNFFRFQNLKVGDRKNLSDVIILPENRNISYSLADESIAKIEDGYLNVLKEGDIELYVTYEYLRRNKVESETVVIDIKAYGNLSSSKYSIDSENKYIYVGNDSNDYILNNLSMDLAELSIENNDLVIKNIQYPYSEIERYKLGRILTSKYLIGTDFIFDENDISVDEIETANCDLTVKNNQISVSYNNKEYAKLDVIKMNTNYIVDGDIIYLGYNNSDELNINITNGYFNISEDGYWVTINSNGNVFVKDYRLVRILSSNYDFESDCVYVSNGQFDSSNTQTNATISVESGKLYISYNNKVYEQKDAAHFNTTYNVYSSVTGGYSNSWNSFALSKKHIYIGYDEFDENKLETINCTYDIDYDNYLLNIKDGNKVLETLKIMYIKYSKYDLTKDYTYIGFNEYSDFYNNIEITNANITYGIDKFIPGIYTNEYSNRYDNYLPLLELQSIAKISLAASSTYVIDYEKKIINVGLDYDYQILSNIIPEVGCGVKIEIRNNKLIVKRYNSSKIIDEWSLVGDISVYNYQKGNNYIYTGISEFSLNNISNNRCKSYQDGNYLVVTTQDDKEIKRYEIRSVLSNKYEFNGNKYAFVGVDDNYIDNINFINLGFEDNNGVILVKDADNNTIDTLHIVSITTDYKIIDNVIYAGSKLDTNKINVKNGFIYANQNYIQIYDDDYYDLITIPVVSLNNWYKEEVDFLEDYLYIGNIDINEFINNKVSINYCGFDYNCSINQVDGKKIEIKKGDTILHEIEIGLISSEVYNLSQNYIYLGNNTFDISKINNVNVTLALKDLDVLEISHGEDILGEIDIISYTSEYDLSKKYLYLKFDNFDINKISCTNCIVRNANNKMNIQYNSDILDSVPLIKLSSNTYDLTKSYIYVGTNDIDKSKINVTNGKTEVTEDNKLSIKYKNDTLDTYDVVKISSSVYDLTKNEIEVVDTFNKDDIKVINGSLEYKNNSLNIKHGNDIVKTFVVRVSKNDTGNNVVTTTTATTKMQSNTTKTTTKKKIVVKGTTTTTKNVTTTTKSSDTTTTSTINDSNDLNTTSISSLKEDKTTVYKEEIKENKTNLSIIIVISLIVILLIIIVIYLTIKNSKNEEQG